MIKASLFFTLFLLIAPAAAQQVHSENDFRRIAPPDWTLSPYGRDRDNGRRFVSPQGNAWLSLYATPVEGSVAAHFVKGVKPGERVTYAKHGRDWAVVSGYTDDDRIFYRRTALACSGRRWHNLDFEYPARDKRVMDEFVTRASHALAAYQSTGCTSGSTP
jgi:hypothetical protein